MMPSNSHKFVAWLGALPLIHAAVALGAELASAGASPPTAGTAAPRLVLSGAVTLRQTGGRNPTVAVDKRAGTVYLAWAQEVAGTALAAPAKSDKKADPKLEVLLVCSDDGGRSFAKSTLVTQPVCGCCGTKVAQGTDGPLYASTRAAWPELKSSVDAVRDIVVVSSGDHGATWSKAFKVHDDRFKISVCPDVAPGLSVDSKGRLHAAWYTGTERHPGVFYAVSADQGKTFSEPIALLTDEWVPYGDVKLALDGHDNAWVAFEDRRGETDLIQLVRVTPNGTLARAQPWSGTIPDVAAFGDSAVVAWGSLAPEAEEQGGGIQTAITSLGAGL